MLKNYYKNTTTNHSKENSMKSQLNNCFFIKKNPIKIKRFFMTIKKSNKNYHKKKCNGTCEVCDCKTGTTTKTIH